MSEWLISRQEIADYAGGVSVWTVSAMIKAGLKTYGGSRRGSPPRTTKTDVDEFIKKNPDFIASDFHRPKPRCRRI